MTTETIASGDAPPSLDVAVAAAELATKQLDNGAGGPGIVSGPHRSREGEVRPHAGRQQRCNSHSRPARRNANLHSARRKSNRVVASQELATAKAALKPGDAATANAVAAAEKKVADAATALAGAHAALAEPSAKYQPLGEQLPQTKHRPTAGVCQVAR